MKYIGHLFYCLAIMVFASACASPTVIVSKSYPATKPESVRILFEKPKKSHEILGHISVHGIGAGSYSNNTKIAVEKMKVSAAEIGADAVVINGPARQSGAAFTSHQGSATAYGYPNSASVYGSGTALTVMGGAGDATLEGMAIKYK